MLCKLGTLASFSHRTDSKVENLPILSNFGQNSGLPDVSQMTNDMRWLSTMRSVIFLSKLVGV